MVLSICDSSTLKIGRRRQPIFQQKLKRIMKQKADVADTLTIKVRVKVLRGSYTTAQQFSHLRVEKIQMHGDGGETYPEKKGVEIPQRCGKGGLLAERRAALFSGHFVSCFLFLSAANK